MKTFSEFIEENDLEEFALQSPIPKSQVKKRDELKKSLEDMKKKLKTMNPEKDSK